MTLPQGYYETNNTPQAIRDLYTLNQDTGEYERVTGGSGAELPTGTTAQVMGFNAQGNPVAKDLTGQMWADPLTGVPAAVATTPDNIVVRDSSGHISAIPATQPNHLITRSQLEAFEDIFYETDEVVRIHEAQIATINNKWTDAMKTAIGNLTESSTLQDVIAALKA